MRIGVDAREVCGRATGVGRYLGGLLREWGASDAVRRHEFVLYAPGPIAMPLDTRRFATRAVAGSGGTWWEQIELPPVAARDHLDVWFAPAYSTPLRLDIPSVVAIHDLSFMAHPEWFRLREGARRRLLARRAARRSRAVITISEFSRGELIERLGVPESRIHVIPPGVTDVTAPAVPGARNTVEPASPSARGTANVLFAGSIFNRRHVPDLIRAFAPIARAHPQARLDIAGDNRTFPHQDIGQAITIDGLERQVRWHRYATDAELTTLFAEAHAFAFLSEYEGLGLTPLEALAAGIPPVLLDTPVARESCEDAALYVPLHDIAATTRALERALFAGETRAAIRERAPRVLSKYNWRRAAAETLAILEGAVR
jgi:glycosyltransferase involved in cell wall biosynthesis